MTERVLFFWRQRQYKCCELICAGLMMSSRDIFGGLKFVDGLAGHTVDDLDPLLSLKRNVSLGRKYTENAWYRGSWAIGSLVANMALISGCVLWVRSCNFR